MFAQKYHTALFRVCKQKRREYIDVVVVVVNCQPVISVFEFYASNYAFVFAVEY